MGYISAEKGVDALVQKSLSPTRQNEGAYIKDASMFLSEDGVDVVEAHSADGAHFVVLPEEFLFCRDKYYSLHVVSKSLGEARSKAQKLPDAAIVDSLRFNDSDDEYLSQVSLFFHNTEKCDNVMINVTKYGHGFRYNTRCEDLGKVSIGQFRYDTSFTNEEHLDSVKFEICCYGDEMSIYNESLRAYNESVYDPYFEQVYPVYNNVDGGYGFVCAYSSDKCYVHIPH
ncbi:MAG: DUF4249 family protein [Bacteroidales bacterium]|nr:DUF4249 family protein [Bacteroidales bacterium]